MCLLRWSSLKLPRYEYKAGVAFTSCTSFLGGPDLDAMPVIAHASTVHEHLWGMLNVLRNQDSVFEIPSVMIIFILVYEDKAVTQYRYHGHCKQGSPGYSVHDIHNLALGVKQIIVERISYSTLSLRGVQACLHTYVPPKSLLSNCILHDREGRDGCNRRT